jgi:hypothetical protein
MAYLCQFSLGLERSDNPRIVPQKECLNPVRVRQLANPFRVDFELDWLNPRLSLRSNRRAEISERLRRYH